MRYASPSALSASLTRLYKIEYIIVKFDHEKSVARLSLRGPEILDEFLHEEIEANKHGYAARGSASLPRSPPHTASPSRLCGALSTVGTWSRARRDRPTAASLLTCSPWRATWHRGAPHALPLCRVPLFVCAYCTHPSGCSLSALIPCLPPMRTTSLPLCEHPPFMPSRLCHSLSRAAVAAKLKKEEAALTIAVFPLMGPAPHSPLPSPLTLPCRRWCLH